jgi:GntR family transcriptional regulator
MRTLDRSSGVPLHRQIQQILAEELRRGDTPVMTEVALMERFSVSRAPVRQALTGLVNEGLVYRERAKGTFPVDRVNVERPAGVQFGGLVGYLADRGLDPESTVRDLRRAVPPAEVQEALRLGPGEKVLSFARRVSVQGQPVSYSRIWIVSPAEFLPTVEELESSGSAVELLEQRYGISYQRSEHHVWAKSADEDEASALQVEVGDPVLVIETTVSSREGKPGVWRRVVDRAEQFKHVFTS